MNEIVEHFYDDRAQRIAKYAAVRARFGGVLNDLMALDYEYNFDMLGRPVIQLPQDIVARQELIWQVQPDLIIETGIAHGGSLILSASMLALLDYCEAVKLGRTLDPRATRRRTVGIDIDIRPHNRVAIETHPMAHRIDLIQGSSLLRSGQWPLNISAF
jgi:cephalosporin hydroxylase